MSQSSITSRGIAPASVTVSVNWAKSILEYTTQHLDEQQAILQKAQLTHDDLFGDHANHTRLSMDQTVQLWGACIEYAQQPFFGLKFGAQIRPSAFHIVGYTLMNSATLKEALDRLNQYQRLISDGGIFQKVPCKQGLWLVYHQKPETLPFYHHQIDAVFSSLLSFARWTTGQEISPLEVSFNRAKPSDQSEYLRLFNVIPNYNQTFDGILISNKTLELPLLESDEELCDMHERHAKQRLEELEENRSVSAQVEHLIKHRLSTLRFSRPSIAKALNMSEKSLQRRLFEEGTNFQQRLDHVREQLACYYLSETTLSLADIAEQLGFTDNSAFYKAFKRWTGQNPGSYRKQLTHI